jgi:hypothetical protein
MSALVTNVEFDPPARAGRPLKFVTTHGTPS